MVNPFTIAEKTILITGGASGIGKATALLCAEMGAKVIITDINQELLNKTFSELEGEGHIQIEANLCKEEDLLELVSALPKLDGFVSNAGIIKTVITQFGKLEDIKKIIDINTVAPLRLTQLLLAKKLIKKEASIVYTSSMAGVYNGAIGNGLYGASKAALVGFIKSLALEQASRGVRVNSVNPGIVDTSIYNGNSMITPELLEEEKKRYPLKRFGKPEEIASAIIYLLSDASKWITGTCLLIDGGMTLV